MSFDESTLFISARSPFARRVRIAFLEHKVLFQEVVLDVFKPSPELIALNPLARVPAIRLKDGKSIIDSDQILSCFYRFNPGSALLGKSESDFAAMAEWSGLSVGLAEKTVEYYLETLRPETAQDSGVIEECETIFGRLLNLFEKQLANRPYAVGDRFSQADVDAGTALAYLSLRWPGPWQQEFHNIKNYLRNLEARESFKKTTPPPP